MAVSVQLLRLGVLLIITRLTYERLSPYIVVPRFLRAQRSGHTASRVPGERVVFLMFQGRVVARQTQFFEKASWPLATTFLARCLRSWQIIMRHYCPQFYCFSAIMAPFAANSLVFPFPGILAVPRLAFLASTLEI